MCGNNDSKSSESGGNGKKRAKVPKRGPGVAKLEEMRREEEQNKDTRRGTSQHPLSPSSSCFFLRPSNPHNYSNNSNTASARHNQHPPHMMNECLGSATATSSSSLPFGLHDPVEPPSNQSSYHNFISWAPQEQKIVGMKRPPPSSLDNSLAPPTHSQVSPVSSHLSRLHQPPSNDSHSASSFASSNDYRRDANWGSPLELNTRKFNSENTGPGLHNFLPFGSPPLSSPTMHAPHYNATEVASHFHKERSMEDWHRWSSGCDRKPFYNFLEVKDHVGLKETTHASNHDEESDGIDLNLKL